MARYWIVGASKALGIGLTNSLRASHEVTGFGRSYPDLGSTASSFVKVDLADPASAEDTFIRCMANGWPDGVVFCQRYRSQLEESTVNAFKAGVDVELAPIVSIFNAALNADVRIPLSIVVISSVAGISAHPDVALEYHLLKAVTIAAVKTLAARGASSSIRVNCIVLGEFEKYSRQQYSPFEIKKFETLEKFVVGGHICGISDIASTTEFLLSNISCSITGQILLLDGGVSNIAPESLIRSFLR